MTQTVCTREMLESGEVLRIAQSAARLGVHEMRIIEPLPCGSLEGDSSATLTAEEKRRLVDLHVTINAEKSLPKAAVFAYTESDAQFGCGAGLQHSYVDAAGNLLPCDFVNKPFGNLLEESAEDIWARVRGTYAAPRCECHAKCPNAAPKTPGFYRRLAGERVAAVE
jgi:MoaA/NifB/PqqE/SkfB family radical SAM enzyme